MFKMGHAHHHEGPPKIENGPCQHAFFIVGEETLFAVHMTQYHCEHHKYQLIFELELEPDTKAELLKMRKAYPRDSFILCNQRDPVPPPSDPKKRKEYSIPQLAAQLDGFTGDIFQGIRPLEGEPPEHYFPWSADQCRPAIPDVKVRKTRVVTFRPFAHHLTLPSKATYLIWGKGGEAHMTNLQTAHRPGGVFDPNIFGPDYDHVMSLQGSTEDWLEPALLEAGIVVSLPHVDLVDGFTGEPTIPCHPPAAEGEKFAIYYRGVGPTYTVTAGPTFLFCTEVCNSPELVPCDAKDACQISLMPEKYWT